MKLPCVTGVADSSRLKGILKQEIERLEAAELPLQQGLERSSRVSPSPFSAMILGVVDTADTLEVKAGIQYKGIIAGCSCADDPSPVDEIDEYCEVLFTIDKTTAEAGVALLTDA